MDDKFSTNHSLKNYLFVVPHRNIDVPYFSIFETLKITAYEQKPWLESDKAE